MMARITAERLVEHLRQSGLVVMKKPPVTRWSTPGWLLTLRRAFEDWHPLPGGPARQRDPRRRQHHANQGRWAQPLTEDRPGNQCGAGRDQEEQAGDLRRRAAA